MFSFQSYTKSVQKQNAARAAYESKRKAENEARAAAGRPLLPDEDSSRLFKPIAKPSKMESFLISTQISETASDLQSMAAIDIAKMHSTLALSS